MRLSPLGVETFAAWNLTVLDIQSCSDRTSFLRCLLKAASKVVKESVSWKKKMVSEMLALILEKQFARIYTF